MSTRDSGYQTPKYLVCRADGQVMQLPLLLYRLAGSLDGRGADRLATDLSAELGRDTTPARVSFLVEERLHPRRGSSPPTTRRPRTPTDP